MIRNTWYIACLRLRLSQLHAWMGRRAAMACSATDFVRLELAYNTTCCCIYTSTFSGRVITYICIFSAVGKSTPDKAQSRYSGGFLRHKGIDARHTTTNPASVLSCSNAAGYVIPYAYLQIVQQYVRTYIRFEIQSFQVRRNRCHSVWKYMDI